MKEILNDEVAYLLGALRDATADVRKGKNYEIKIAQKESSWLRFLQNIFKKNFDISGNITQHVNGTEILRISGKDTVNTILKISEMKIPQELWNTPSIIKRQPIGLQLHYLRGFFDAEGGIPHNSGRFYIQLVQKNLPKIELIKELLIELGIKSGRIHNPSKRVDPDYWRIFILADSYKKFADLIGSLHPIKSDIFRKRVMI